MASNIVNQPVELLLILLKRFDTGLPGGGAGWSVRFRPVIVWPFLLFIVRALFSGKIKNVTLCKAHVFEQLPGAVRSALRFHAAERLREIFDGRSEFYVRLTSADRYSELRAKSFQFISVHTGFDSLGRCRILIILVLRIRRV